MSISLYADGGTIGGSPGKGIYWSVATESGVPLIRETDDSGRWKFSDQAEYLALHSALQLVQQSCKDGDRVLVHTDCRPLVRQITLSLTPRRPRCRPLYWQCVELLERLKARGIEVILKWVVRKEMVERLGH